MQNMDLAAGHCGQALVKKSMACIYNFRFTPNNWLSWDLGTREGRLIRKDGSGDGFFYMINKTIMEGKSLVILTSGASAVPVGICRRGNDTIAIQGTFTKWCKYAPYPILKPLDGENKMEPACPD